MNALLVAVAVASLGLGARLAARRDRSRRHRPMARLAPGRRSLDLLRRRSSAVGDLGELTRLRTALAAGSSVRQALATLAVAGGPWHQPAAEADRALRRGLSLDDALGAWRATDGDGPRGLVADGLALAAATGGSQLAAVDAVTDAVRERDALRREVRALAAQAQASAAVTVAAPVAFAVLLAVTDARVRAFYLSLPGLACLGAGALLDLSGAAWMGRIVARVR